MFKRILAPVDGREHSEPVLPVLRAVARESGATVRLLRVLPVPEHIVTAEGRTVAYVDQEMARLTEQGMQDLRGVEAQLHDVPVEREVRFGKPVEEILLEAEAFDADVITLSGAPSGRVRRFFTPDVAEQVASRAQVPTLVLRR